MHFSSKKFAYIKNLLYLCIEFKNLVVKMYVTYSRLDRIHKKHLFINNKKYDIMETLIKTQKVKIAIFVIDNTTNSCLLDVDIAYVSEKYTQEELFEIANKYYSKCENLKVQDVRVIDKLHISMTL